MAKIRINLDIKPGYLESLKELQWEERKSRNALIEEAVKLLLNQRNERRTA